MQMTALPAPTCSHRMSDTGQYDDVSARMTETGQGHTILIVDDDPINVSILQDLLHNVNYHTLVGGAQWLLVCEREDEGR